MQLVLVSLSRAILSQLHPKMLLLTLWPFLFSIAIWGAGLYFGLQPATDWLQSFFTTHDSFRIAGDMLDAFGLGALKTAATPLIAMLLLLPLMVVTALLFVGAIAMPAIVRHVAQRHYPELERREGGTLIGSIGAFITAFAVFIVLWIVTLPLHAIPLLTFLIQPVLWGWLTYRVMAYDAMAEHANTEERRAILRTRRWPLLLIGTITGAVGAAPTLLWLGGALSVFLFPLFAAVSIWLYVLIFTLTGLWFAHYCLAVLSRRRLASHLD